MPDIIPGVEVPASLGKRRVLAAARLRRLADLRTEGRLKVARRRPFLDGSNPAVTAQAS